MFWHIRELSIFDSEARWDTLRNSLVLDRSRVEGAPYVQRFRLVLVGSQRDGKVLDGTLGALATGFATKDNSPSPTETLPQPAPRKHITKRDSGIAEIAILAANAVRNADLHRALELIEEIRVLRVDA